MTSFELKKINNKDINFNDFNIALCTCFPDVKLQAIHLESEWLSFSKNKIDYFLKSCFGKKLFEYFVNQPE